MAMILTVATESASMSPYAQTELQFSGGGPDSQLAGPRAGESREAVGPLPRRRSVEAPDVVHAASREVRDLAPRAHVHPRLPPVPCPALDVDPLARGQDRPVPRRPERGRLVGSYSILDPLKTKL
ncbi:hypothetical protein DL765_008671 [Monosporascus sp. GIB2]|nr:hypothetical protein DL765_008671 [Monosporascus sp. GIB2]